jgi:hypothetical protein
MNRAYLWRWRGGSLLLAVLLGTCSYFVVRAVVVRNVVKAASSIVPFTYKGHIYLFGTNPIGQLRTDLTFARRSDGTTVEVRSVGPLEAKLNVRTIRYMDGGLISIVDAMQAKEAWPPRGSRAAAFRRALAVNPPSTCTFGKEDTVLNDGSVISGQRVDVVRHDAVGGVRITEWRAPELGCTALQATVEQVQSDGSYKLLSQREFVTLQLAEPDPNLFKTEQHYTELGPSQFARDIRERLGYSTPGPAETSAADFDAQYENGLVSKPDWVSTH